MSWFMFSDAFTGGNPKTPYAHLVVEAGSEMEAAQIMRDRHGVFVHDFYVAQALTLDRVTEGERHRGLSVYDTQVGVEDFLARADVDMVPTKQMATSTT